MLNSPTMKIIVYTESEKSIQFYENNHQFTYFRLPCRKRIVKKRKTGYNLLTIDSRQLSTIYDSRR